MSHKIYHISEYNENTKKKCLDIGKNVLMEESRALNILAESLSYRYVEVIEKILSIKGRIITTGIGKSGHVARKIAATLASTGSPSFFVHPTEASHGDLGVCTEHDIIIALSNSGETLELNDILIFAERNNIPLIGITMNATSKLAKYATIPLIIPKLEEVCPMKCAPTTSTTMMMALGDAIAINLIHAKNFTKEHFKNFHPGGKLGMKLLKVSDIMHKDLLPLVSENESMQDVICTMTSCSFGSAGVLKNDELVGIITDGDLRRNMSKNLLSLKAKDIMSLNPFTLSSDMLAAKALKQMNDSKITSAFIIDDMNKPHGILHVHDCLHVGLG